MVTKVNEDSNATADTPVLSITPEAVVKVKELLAGRNLEGYALRVFVSGGGCSGLQYGMALEEKPDENDTVVETDDVSLLIDPMSLQYLAGANIDYVDSLMGGGFRIDNPNAVSSCGCGHSFRTDESAGATGEGCSSCG